MANKYAGTQTEKNLEAAFAGESQARNKYTYFASKAKKEGFEQIAELSDPFLSQGKQYGEGWFLTGEMAELLLTGVPDIVCIQPFACLPHHVEGKGVIKQLRKKYPQANICAVDFDPGASEVNQHNREKLMLSAARLNMEPAAQKSSKL